MRWNMAAVRPHERVYAEISGRSRTRQEFQDECDINAIMKRYEKTGVLTHYSKREPQYIDFGDGVPDFHTAMNMMVAAETAFLTLPAVVRKRFENDPQEFVAFASNAENIGQLREWGLAAPEKAADAPIRVEVTNPTPAAAAS